MTDPVNQVLEHLQPSFKMGRMAPEGAYTHRHGQAVFSLSVDPADPNSVQYKYAVPQLNGSEDA